MDDFGIAMLWIWLIPIAAFIAVFASCWVSGDESRKEETEE